MQEVYFGEIQHGHMEQVGYDTYCKLLDEVVKEMQGIKVKEEKDIQIDMNVSSFIPDEYIENSSQKITDLLIATAADYNPKSEDAYTFFKIVQNKLHFAISGHTAAELIFKRANSKEEHMGLTTWKNSPDGLI